MHLVLRAPFIEQRIRIYDKSQMQRDHAQRRLFEVLGAAGQVARHDDAEIAVCGIEGGVDNAAVGHAAGEPHAADAKVAQQQLDAAKEQAALLEEKSVTLSIKAGEGGKAFGSVSSKEIAAAYKEQCNMEIDKKKIQLPK